MLLIPVFDEESESAIRFGPFLHLDSVLTQTPHHTQHIEGASAQSADAVKRKPWPLAGRV